MAMSIKEFSKQLQDFITQQDFNITKVQSEIKSALSLLDEKLIKVDELIQLKPWIDQQFEGNFTEFIT